MNKKNKLIKRKFISNTYMREAVNYDIVTIKEDNLFITIKKYKEVTDRFIITDSNGNDIVYIDNGYYLVELTPLDEKYNMRFYFDNNKNFIDYYIDITYENGTLYKMPYYIDLYLDIVHIPENNTVIFIDEDELKEALDKKIISKKDYKMAYEVGNKLLAEIKNNSNKFLNMDVKKYIDKYF